MSCIRLARAGRGLLAQGGPYVPVGQTGVGSTISDRNIPDAQPKLNYLTIISFSNKKESNLKRNKIFDPWPTPEPK